jgi:hypothetical protein
MATLARVGQWPISELTALSTHRFRPGTYAHIERMAASSGRRIVRELVDKAIAGRITDGLKRQRKK